MSGRASRASGCRKLTAVTVGTNSCESKAKGGQKMLTLTEGNRNAKEGDRIETSVGQQARRSAFSVATGGNVERSSETAQRCHGAATLGNPAKQCRPQLREGTGQDRDQCRAISSALGGQRCHGAATLKELADRARPQDREGTRQDRYQCRPKSSALSVQRCHGTATLGGFSGHGSEDAQKGKRRPPVACASRPRPAALADSGGR